jgi:hypothetical protein
MATQTQIEVARDLNGLQTRTITKQAFTWEDPADDARSYKVTQGDGVVTIVEEFYDTNGTAIYNGDISLTTEPLESHPKVSSLTTNQFDDWSRWKTNHNDPKLNGWDPANDNSGMIQFLYLNYIRGITTYLAPRAVIKHVEILDEAPNISAVGQISETGYPGDSGDRNFIMSGISFQQEGEKWRVTTEYLGSQAGKVWDPQIYTLS